MSPTPADAASRGPQQAFQGVCRECGDPFVSNRENKILCGKNSCRIRRQRRRKKQGADFTEWAQDFSDVTALLSKAEESAMTNLHLVAREVLADSIRPTIEKALVAEDVLASIAGLVGLLPLVQDALKADLSAMKHIRDAMGHPIMCDGEPVMEPDRDVRGKAIAHILKYTAGQPGLAPQPEQAVVAPPSVIFMGMPPMPEAPVDAEVAELLPEVESGELRVCDACGKPKAPDLFVGNSERCQECHDAVRERAMARLASGQQGG